MAFHSDQADPVSDVDPVLRLYLLASSEHRARELEAEVDRERQRIRRLAGAWCADGGLSEVVVGEVLGAPSTLVSRWVDDYRASQAAPVIDYDAVARS